MWLALNIPNDFGETLIRVNQSNEYKLKLLLDSTTYLHKDWWGSTPKRHLACGSPTQRTRQLYNILKFVTVDWALKIYI